jgi:hypothetical protein
MTYEGRLEHKDLGTGVWVLHTGTKTVALYGSIPMDLNGQQVVVEGEPIDGMGIGMVGDAMVQVENVVRK